MKIEGFLKGKSVSSKEIDTIHKAVRCFQGKKLDEMKINVTINNLEDLRELEQFLWVATTCFGGGDQRTLAEIMEDQ